MKRLVRPLMLVCLLLAVVLGLSGCISINGESTEPSATTPPLTAEQFTDYDAVYIHYNQVTFSDTLETLTERFGEPTDSASDDNGTTYTWIFEDGYGFVCTFYETGELRAKVVYYEDVRQFRDLCDARNLSSAEYLEDTNDFQTCVDIFVGRPIEVAQISSEDSTNTVISRVYTWIDADENLVQILFNADGTVESVSYSVE